MIRAKSIYNLLKWVIILLAYLFLAYKLATFDKYDLLLEEWTRMPVERVWWLGYVLALLPFNWLLEAIKWRRMVSIVERISIGRAYKAVLAGISTGFFTPNRVGELIGRVVFMGEGNRKPGVTLSLVNSLTQNSVMALCGIPSCIYFFAKTQGGIETDMAGFLLMMLFFLLGFFALYSSLPNISKKLSESDLSVKIKEFVSCLSEYSSLDLMLLMLISFVRYVVFCTQFFSMLQFFGIDLTIWEAIVAIPSNYLLVTFTPSLAFSEAAVRSSSALLFIGAFSSKVVNVALAGVGIWAVNFVIPMLVGTVIMMTVKSREGIDKSQKSKDASHKTKDME
jgi:Lysylphosphatidylglycerol synthase TM region